MKSEQQLREKKEELESAAKIINQAKADPEGQINVSQLAIYDLLLDGIDAIDELERLRKAVGPSYLSKVDVIVDGMRKKRRK